MPDLLIELLSEEIPARMQNRAAEDFKNLLVKSLADSGLTNEEAKAYCTPRRLALQIAGLPVRTADMREERKGPRLGAPDKAISGFLQAAGLSSVDEATVVSDPKKGDYYVATIERPGRDAKEVIAECLKGLIHEFPWPKSMRWGNRQLHWIRPLHSVLCTFGPASGNADIVSFELEGIPVGNQTRGHLHMANGLIAVDGFEDYVSKLEKAHVILDAKQRSGMIQRDANEKALDLGLELVEDGWLLEETAGLVEWPKVLVGKFDEAFLAIPDEVIRASIRGHQKCFVMLDPKTGNLSNRFALVSNIEAADGGKAVVSGNERVIAARLSDAKFFWESDLKTPLESLTPRLKEIVFFRGMGTVADRTERIRQIAKGISQVVGADRTKAERAAMLAKADLVSSMVYEFPELQGIMGRQYAMVQGEDQSVADAIEYHYKPVGQSDDVPEEPVSIAVAIADKLDALVCFWTKDEKPTSSKDPYALRRAALGLVSIILRNNLRIRLRPLLRKCFHIAILDIIDSPDRILRESTEANTREQELARMIVPSDGIGIGDLLKETEGLESGAAEEYLKSVPEWGIEMEMLDDLLGFISDRLKIALRDKGIRHDLIDAVFSLSGQDDISLAEKRVAALGDFIDSHDGTNLLAGFKRSANILRMEEKKDGTAFDDGFKDDLLKEDAERELAGLLRNVRKDARTSIENEDFVGAMESLARLRPAVDRFFDEILVNSEEPDIRRNRLNILNEFRQATLEVADFAKIGN